MLLVKAVRLLIVRLSQCVTVMDFLMDRCKID
jgi:hypothetical protein